MGRHDDESDDDLDDSDLPDESDVNDSDSADTEPCPYCGKPVYEGAEICPHCRSFLSFEERPSRKPLWIILAALACVAAILLFWLR